MVGIYRSRFRGAGITFAQVREYTWGDDFRWIDWNVTARMNRPFVKEFEEERERAVLVAVHLSVSLLHAEEGRPSLWWTLIRAGALLAGGALWAGDRVGTLSWSESGIQFVPFQKERKKLPLLALPLLQVPARTPGISHLLREILQRSPPHTLVFVLTDLHPLVEFREETLIRQVARQTDLHWMVIVDPAEGFSGIPLTVAWDTDTYLMGIQRFRSRIARNYQYVLYRWKRTIRQAGGSVEILRTDIPLPVQLSSYHMKTRTRERY